MTKDRTWQKTEARERQVHFFLFSRLLDKLVPTYLVANAELISLLRHHQYI